MTPIIYRKTKYLIPVSIFILALTVRLIDLGQFLTADEPRAWYGWSMQFTQAILDGRLEDTIYSGSPGITLFLLGAIGLYLAYLFKFNLGDDFATFLTDLPFDPISSDIIFWFQLPSVILGAISVTITYLLAKRLFNLKIALVGGLLVAFDPLFIGMNRVLSTDGITASFVINAVLAMLLFATYKNKVGPSNKMLIISAIFAGLAILTKTTALFLLPFFGLVILLTVIYHREWSQLSGYIVAGLVWVGLVFVTIFIFWPALWIHPVDTLQKLYAFLSTAVGEPHNRGSFFWGVPVPDPGIWFFGVVTYFRLTVITTIGMGLGVLYLFSKKTAAQPRKLDVVFLFLFMIFYIVFLSIGGKKNDRYITLILPVANLIAAVGYVWVTAMLKRATWQNLSLVSVVILQIVIAIQYAPYYLSHYNLLAGGSKTAPYAILVGWGEGLDQAASYLNSLPNSENLKVASWYHSNFEPFFKGRAVEKGGDEKISRSAKPALASDYVVLYINQIQRQMPTPGMIQYYQSFPPEHVVTINGIDYAFIYPSPAVEYPLTGEIRLVGQAELLGYDLLDENENTITTLAPDQTTLLQLYWEWQGKLPDEPIGMSLVDDAGQSWGWGTPLGTTARLPFEVWQEGMIARDDFALTIFPGTPPGEYWLKFWLDRPATGERVGDFPMSEDMRVIVDRPASPPLLADLNLSTSLDVSSSKESISLLGFVDEQSFQELWLPGETRNLWLYWQANQAVKQSYPVTLSLVDIESGDTKAEWSALPVDGRFPTDQWQSGDIIRDPWQLTLPAYVPPGAYQLAVRIGDDAPVDVLVVSVEGRTRLFDAPVLEMSLDTMFGESIQLLGLQSPPVIKIEPGQPLTFNPVWRANDLVDADYTVSAQLLNGQQQVIAQRDSMPLAGAAPTTSWAIGEVVSDEITLDVPAEIGDGPHTLLLALYRVETGERLRLPNGADHLEIPVITDSP